MPWRRAVDEDRIMHAYGRRKQLILFDDVDINTQIEVVAGQHMGRRGRAESAETAGDRAGKGRMTCRTLVGLAKLELAIP
jgi:hypothetical protein